MKTRSILLLTIGLLSTPALAADLQAGKALHNEHCMKCHDAGVYQRGDQGRIHSLQGLEKQVRRCELSQGLQWFDDDIANVVNYLNETYYHFPE